jgi:hypothetical protein
MGNWKWTQDDRLFAARFTRMPRLDEVVTLGRDGYAAALAEAFRLDENGRDAHDGGPPEQALNHVMEFVWADLEEMNRRADRATAVLVADAERSRAQLQEVEAAMLADVDPKKGN